MNHRNNLLLTCFLISLAAFLPAKDAPAALVSIQTEAAVAGDVVRLGDVADVSDVEPEDLVKLSKTIICAAPPPGQVQVISAGAIVSALAGSGVQLAGTKVSGAQGVVVKRVCELLSPDELTEAFRAHVIEKTGWAPGSFTAHPPKNLAPMPVPSGHRTLVVSTALGEQFSNSVVAKFEILVDGKRYRAISHRFTVDRYVKTLVAVAKLRRGQPAEQGEFKLAQVERSRLDGDPVTDIKQLTGKIAARTVFPDTPLTMQFFSSPPLVKRGQDVAVVWEGNGFKITTKALALDNGAASDIVRVRLNSRKIVEARVTDSGTLCITN